MFAKRMKEVQEKAQAYKVQPVEMTYQTRLKEVVPRELNRVPTQLCSRLYTTLHGLCALLNKWFTLWLV